MGNCAPCPSFGLRADLETESEDLKLSLKTSDILGRVARKQSDKLKKIIPCVHFPEISYKQKSVLGDELWISNCKMPSMTDVCLKLTFGDSRSQTFTTSESLPAISSLASQASESFQIEDLRSYDGVNMRSTDRYEIGICMLKAQIHHGADPKTLVTHGERSCLMFAVLAQDFNFVKQLVELGVDVNQTNARGETALSLANELQRDDIISYLRSKGAVEALGKDSKSVEFYN